LYHQIVGHGYWCWVEMKILTHGKLRAPGWAEIKTPHCWRSLPTSNSCTCWKLTLPFGRTKVFRMSFLSHGIG